MKKIISTVLFVALLVTAIVSASAGSFVDVPEDAYYAAAAERMADRKILSGYGDNYYYGSHNVNRGQIAAVVCKILGKVDEATALAGVTAFSDVSEKHWSAGYVNYAVANEIITGDGDGRFRPDDNVKYEEVIKVIVCILGLDENIKIDPNDWSKEYIEAADKAGLTKNLIGKKGEPMLRSDIAVICDAAMTVIDGKNAETTVDTTTATKRPSSDDEDEPEDAEVTTKTTTATTKATTKVTTKATTKATTKVEEPEETTEVVTTKSDRNDPEVTTTTVTTKANPTGTQATSTWIDENGFPMGDNYGEWV